jgi:hypothetical protein
MSATRDQLVEAFRVGDQITVRRLGWWDVYSAWVTWWAPRQTGTSSEFVPVAKAAGDHDPALVLEALRACAGPFRPTAGELLGYLNDRRRSTDSVDVGRASDPTNTPAALAAVTRAIAEGAHVCDCGNPTGRTWLLDRHGVLRCRRCDGVEVGQAWQAEDAQPETEAA